MYQKIFADDTEYNNFSLANFRLGEKKEKKLIPNPILAVPKKIKTKKSLNELLLIKRKLNLRNSLLLGIKEAKAKQSVSEVKSLEAKVLELTKELNDLETQLLSTTELNQKKILDAIEELKKNPNIPIQSVAEIIPEATTEDVEEVVKEEQKEQSQSLAPAKNSWILPALVIGVIVYIVFKK